MASLPDALAALDDVRLQRPRVRRLGDLWRLVGESARLRGLDLHALGGRERRALRAQAVRLFEGLQAHRDRHADPVGAHWCVALAPVGGGRFAAVACGNTRSLPVAYVPAGGDALARLREEAQVEGVTLGEPLGEPERVAPGIVARVLTSGHAPGLGLTWREAQAVLERYRQGAEQERLGALREAYSAARPLRVPATATGAAARALAEAFGDHGGCAEDPRHSAMAWPVADGWRLMVDQDEPVTYPERGRLVETLSLRFPLLRPATETLPDWSAVHALVVEGVEDAPTAGALARVLRLAARVRPEDTLSCTVEDAAYSLRVRGTTAHGLRLVAEAAGQERVPLLLRPPADAAPAAWVVAWVTLALGEDHRQADPAAPLTVSARWCADAPPVRCLLAEGLQAPCPPWRLFRAHMPREESAYAEGCERWAALPPAWRSDVEHAG